MFKFRSLRVTGILLTAFVASSLAFDCQPAKSATEEATDQATVDLIRHANIVNSAYKLTVALSSEEALITTQRKPKATDAESKILATLIAKTAFEAIPERIQRVKVVLLDYDADASSTIVVNRAVIKLYGSGALSDKELLGSLDITTTGGSSAKSGAPSTVQTGPQEVDRMLLLGRIENLKKKGTNVSAFMNFFNQIEESAKNGDDKGVASKIDYLREHLSEQEKLVKQAKSVSSAASHARTAASSGSGTGSGSVSFDDVARQYSEGKIPQDVLNLAMRQANFSARLLMCDPNKVNIQAAQLQLQEVTNLAATHKTAEAQKLMTDLEAKFGH